MIENVNMERYFTEEELKKASKKYDRYTNEDLLEKIKKICNSEEVQEIIKYMLTDYEIRIKASDLLRILGG